MMERPASKKLSVVQEETLEEYAQLEKAFAALKTFGRDESGKTITPDLQVSSFSSLAEKSPVQDTSYLYLLSPNRLRSRTKYGYEMTLAESETGASGIDASHSIALSVINETRTGDHTTSFFNKTTDTNKMPNESNLHLLFHKCKSLTKELEQSRRLNQRLLEKYTTTNQELLHTKQALKRYQQADKKDSDMIRQFLGEKRK